MPFPDSGNAKEGCRHEKYRVKDHKRLHISLLNQNYQILAQHALTSYTFESIIPPNPKAWICFSLLKSICRQMIQQALDEHLEVLESNLHTNTEATPVIAFWYLLVQCLARSNSPSAPHRYEFDSPLSTQRTVTQLSTAGPTTSPRQPAPPSCSVPNSA